MMQVETPALAVRADLDLRSQNTMPKDNTAYKHVLLPAEDGPLLEWFRVQTGGRSLTRTMSLLVQIATTPEGLAFIKNHPLCEVSERPPHPHPLCTAHHHPHTAGGHPVKVGAAVTARMLKDGN